MSDITQDTSMCEIAALVSEALEAADYFGPRQARFYQFAETASRLIEKPH